MKKGACLKIDAVNAAGLAKAFAELLEHPAFAQYYVEGEWRALVAALSQGRGVEIAPAAAPGAS